MKCRWNGCAGSSARRSVSINHRYPIKEQAVVAQTIRTCVQRPAQAIRAGLVDEYQLFLTPIIVGGGKRSLPDGVLTRLELLDERRFVSGVVHLHYRTRT